MDISVDINAFNNEMLAVQRDFAEHLTKMLQGAALSSFAKIRNRIQNTGKGSHEEELPMYSPKYKESKSARYGDVSVRFRNLTFTGDMWRNIGITATEQQKAGLTIIIDGETDFSRKKMNWNADQIGDFLSVSKKEEIEATEDFQNEIDRYFESKKR